MRSLIALCLVLAASVSISHAVFNCEAVSVDEATIYSFCKLYNGFTSLPSVSDSKSGAEGTFNVSLGHNAPQCNVTNTTTVLGTFEEPNQPCLDVIDTEPIVTLLDQDDPAGGLVLTYNAASGSRYSLVANLKCNKDLDEKYTFDQVTLANDVFTVNVESSNSCPNVTLSKISFYFNKYRAVFVTLFIILGLFVCFAGLTMLKYTIFLIGAIGGTVVSATLFLSLIGYDAHAATFWLIFAVCVVIGCVLGWIAVKIETLGFIILGGVLGVVGGQLLFTAALAPMGAKVAVYWITLVVAAAIGAGLAYKFWKSFVIIATGILGSFMVVKAIGGAVGNFPSAESMAKGFSFNGVIYAYLAGIVILAIAGMYVQHKNKKKAEVEEEQDVHGYQRVMAGYNA